MKVICMEFKKKWKFWDTIFNMPYEGFFYFLIQGKTMGLFIQWILQLSKLFAAKTLLDAFTFPFNLENMDFFRSMIFLQAGVTLVGIRQG